MLFVSTNNQKQISLLQEQFTREGNLFAVPMKKTGIISQILSQICFQIFGHLNKQLANDDKNKFPLMNLVQKVLTFIQNVFNLNISLSAVNEIFQIIKLYSTKIKLYEEYILEIDRKFKIKLDNQLQQFTQNEYEDNLQLVLSQNYQAHKLSNIVNDTQLLNIDTGIELKQPQCEKSYENSISTVVKNQRINEDAQTMHTLKSQLPNSPKFSLNKIGQFNLSELASKQNRLDESFNYSQDNNNHKHDELNETINNQYLLKTQNNLNSIFYCPDYKKDQNKNKLIIQSLKNIENGHQQKNGSGFCDLSGRVHPVPSFLHDNSIGQMIVKQKKQDVRKSNILRKSIINVQENKKASTQNTYSSNIRMIKFHNKLRRNSKKSLVSKEDLKQEPHAQNPVQKQKYLINIRHSDHKIVKIKKNLQHNQIEDDGELENQFQRKLIENKKQQDINISQKKTKSKVQVKNFFMSHN